MTFAIWFWIAIEIPIYGPLTLRTFLFMNLLVLVVMMIFKGKGDSGKGSSNG